MKLTVLQRPLKRETCLIYRGAPLVVTLHAKYLAINQKGHGSFTVDYEAIFDLARKLEARRREGAA